MTQTALDKKTLSLSALDRCDKCNARALTYAWNMNGQELMFCGHHGRKFEAGLESQGFIVEFQETD